LRWMDDVLADLRAMRIKQWTEKAEDRQQWRLVVKEAKAHPGLQRRVDGWMELWLLLLPEDCKRSVQCHVLDKSPPGLRSGGKHPVQTSHRSRFVENVSLAISFGSYDNPYAVSTQSDTCICTHVLHNTETLVGHNK
jgi:hypothetical protein